MAAMLAVFSIVSGRWWPAVAKAFAARVRWLIAVGAILMIGLSAHTACGI